MSAQTVFNDGPEHIPSESVLKFSTVPYYSMKRGGPCTARLDFVVLARKIGQRSRRAPVPCQATWTKATAPWLKKERARIAAEIEANKKGTK